MTLSGGLLDRLRRDVLAAVPRPAGTSPELRRFGELLCDYPRRPGKALRGRLVLLSAAAHGGDAEEALPAAVALELFQNWVLVHDDIEDDSETRRGSPALHREVGVPVAINVGDALHVAMWRVLVQHDRPWRDAALAEMLDTIDRTAEGQHLDLAWVAAGRLDVREDEYLGMVDRKTAYYTLIAPLRLGAVAAGASPDPRIEPAGLSLGRAFQIRDDVLNLLPQEHGSYGKEFVGDLYEGKRTLVLARAFEVLGATDADRLARLLGRPRRAKNEVEMREALDLLERAGAIDYAQEVAREAAATGLSLLREVFAQAADRRAADEILAMASDLAERRA